MLHLENLMLTTLDLSFAVLKDYISFLKLETHWKLLLLLEAYAQLIHCPVVPIFSPVCKNFWISDQFLIYYIQVHTDYR